MKHKTPIFLSACILAVAIVLLLLPKNEKVTQLEETAPKQPKVNPYAVQVQEKFQRIEELDSLGKAVLDSIQNGLLVFDSVESIDSVLHLFLSNEPNRDGMGTSTMLMEHFLKNPLTFHNRLKKTQGLNYMHTFDALDKSFKIWSYDNCCGGTQRFYENFIQYQDSKGDVSYQRFYLFGPEGEEPENLSNPMIYEVYPLQHDGKYYYLLLMEKQKERTDGIKHVAIVTFKNGKPSYHTSFFPKGCIAHGEHCLSIDDISDSAQLSYDPTSYEISYNTEEYHRDSPPTVTTHKIKLIINETPLTDYGEPFPIDAYKQACYFRGKPESEIEERAFIGDWVQYGHLYDPRQFLTLKADGTYVWILEECLGRENDSSPMQYEFTEKRTGKFTYNPEQNKITLLRFRSEDMILESEYFKYADPSSHEMIVYSIKGDEMKVYEDTDDAYYRRKQ